MSKIQDILREERQGENVSDVVFTTLGTVQRVLTQGGERATDPDRTAWIVCNMLKEAAQHLKGDPEHWIWKNQFSEDLFSYFFIQSYDTIGIYADLMEVLKSLPYTERGEPSLTHVQNFLSQVAYYAGRIRDQLD